jgi:hypothetical protein
MAWHGRTKRGQQLGRDTGAVVERQTTCFSEEAIDGIIHQIVRSAPLLAGA